MYEFSYKFEICIYVSFNAWDSQVSSFTPFPVPLKMFPKYFGGFLRMLTIISAFLKTNFVRQRKPGPALSERARVPVWANICRFFN